MNLRHANSTRSIRNTLGVTTALTLMCADAIALASLSRLFTRGSVVLAPIFISLSMHLAALLASRAFKTVAGRVITSYVVGAIACAVVVSRLKRKHPWITDLRGAFRGAGHTILRDHGRLPVTAPREIAVALLAIVLTATTMLLCSLPARFTALVPSFMVFALSSTLGTANGRWLLTSGYIAVAAIWLSGSRNRPPGQRRTWRIDMTVAVVIAAIGAMAGAGITVLSNPPLWDWREAASFELPSTIQLDSLDNVADWLRRKPAELFVVKAKQPEYWRMFALDTFDGESWSIRADTARSAEADANAGEGADRLVQDISIAGLVSSEIPGAFVPTNITPISRGFPETLSMPETHNFVLTRPTRRGDEYRVVSLLGDHATQAPSDSKTLELDPAFAQRIRDAISKVADPKATPEEQLAQVEGWLRGPSFRYDINAAFDPSQRGVLAFLTAPTPSGFCQHFATAFALIARSLGLPARVAIGFRPGDSSPGTGGSLVFSVKTNMAHAWPEVFINDRGWVPFEPTPGSASNPIRNPRDPNSLAPAQPPIDQPAPGSAASTSLTTASTPRPASSISAGSAAVSSLPAAGGTASQSTQSSASTWWLLGAGLGVLGLVLVAVVRRRRRLLREHDADPRNALASLWRDLVSHRSRAGAFVPPNATIHEEARSVKRGLPREDAEVITKMADVLSTLSYSEAEVPDEINEQSHAEASELLDRLKAETESAGVQRPQRRLRERSPN